MAKKRVIISACLLGEVCRYDGKIKKADKVVKFYKDYEIIPFCPEAPLFGTPRERINVVNIEGKDRILTDIGNIDVTKLLEDEIYSFIKKNQNIDEIVLKSKSPSCGLGTTAIMGNNNKKIGNGDGIAAKIFKISYKTAEIKDETLAWNNKYL